MKDTEKLKLIETYLSGEMSDAEQKAFKAKLKSDQELRELLELDQDVDLALENIDLIKTRQMLEKIKSESRDSEEGEKQ
ncbi:MAG: hypothetical protein K9G67_09340 [Bacteroidales bacterium]|nr:hypothetical protein [Bacteroidales bacterium]MCF8344224.1 hypothetical protein [Bacteroidales bacterium]MCF8350956.1 hypothetical protein [Bacteroidales bacterium]MCF8376545.1 hypothetical protein [Bacteroidales bacterium]MCF8400603.1 hypothetical protein [Bacteroidales bacterium]